MQFVMCCKACETCVGFVYNLMVPLCRGFNDAINGFNDDGWSILPCEGAEDVAVAINSAKNLTTTSNAVSLLGGVLCAKASMLLQVIFAY